MRSKSAMNQLASCVRRSETPAHLRTRPDWCRYRASTARSASKGATELTNSRSPRGAAQRISRQTRPRSASLNASASAERRRNCVFGDHWRSGSMASHGQRNTAERWFLSVCCYEAGCQVATVNCPVKSRTNLLCVLGAPDKGMRSQAGAAIYRRGPMPAADGTRSAPLAGPHCPRTDDSPRDTPFGSIDHLMNV